MQSPEQVPSVHPLGESLSKVLASNWPVDTPGGRYYAELDYEAPVTREGQLIFFAQFLHTGGRWSEFVRQAPLHYTGNRGRRVVDVLGTAALSILCGHWRYAHINAVRGDTLNPPLLGMTTTVSEDVVRRALRRIEEPAGLAWLAGALRDCVQPVLSQPWILDIDATVKPIYGHQQGAQVGYNPHRPGRPSHCYHSYFMANTRLCLGVEVLGGKAHAGRHGLPGLWSLLDALPRTHWPTLLRGDCGYGNEVLLGEAEARGVPGLFKLRQTPKVKTLIALLQRGRSRLAGRRRRLGGFGGKPAVDGLDAGTPRGLGAGSACAGTARSPSTPASRLPRRGLAWERNVASVLGAVVGADRGVGHHAR